ncbi:hypothetical protein [Jannaschia rubra]|uniref:Lipoprotein n=1 Tax=Jannaschia rubra TaxID=282197 RepID=A0A0M6XN46_9RHOB|nr:hypothetical protein [Jannaschia rubra]CTQ32092.1 hypothetical protein JAN5088_00854 [Jannaschia rubra]SFG37781.1 hypothetical protein SAMN04488517_104140 [Jannaschia rubra]
MKRSLLILPLLAACALPTANGPVPDPQAYAITDAPIPFAVGRLLPRGITERDVRVAENCYGYAYQGQIYPVLIPRGTQYCL